MQLNNAKTKTKYIISYVDDSKRLGKRLKELGFVKSTEVVILYKSMFSRSKCVSLRGYILSIQNSALNLVTVSEKVV